MHIVVCLKQVPRDNSVKINPDLSINSDGIEQIMNLFDEYAVEEGIKWNEQHGGKVTVLSLGPDAWKEQMRRALAMGATDALLLNDPAFTMLDTIGAARVSAAAINRLGDVDLVICGRNSTDDESGAFGPALARVLGWPQLTYVGKISELDDNHIVAERHLEEQIETVETKLPAVITVVKDINEPRYPSLLRIKRVAKVEIPTMSAAEVDLTAADLQPVTTIANRVPPPPRQKGEIIQGGDAREKVRALVEKLRAEQVI
ncbi:MAG TPA: electron transfer flavoprotein subunit beta/FixA family protein [Roseiflexaceae bacterium]|jgi:electron transfer flavoprotein beta subunit|nr:electron transfer flavoprotein subunit beta/FixA family protein [Roseiflexaceae bacterium]